MKVKLGLIIGLLIVAGSLSAHHSDAVYDLEYPITLQDTVSDFKFINPHVQIHFEAAQEDATMVTWFDRSGAPHSDQLHIIERFQRVDQETLEVEFWFEDPKAFTKPFGSKKLYRPEPEILEHFICDEHLKIGTYREVNWPQPAL